MKIFPNVIIGITILCCVYLLSCKKEASVNAVKASTKITDIDGNIYHSVTIGTQVWMVENLKTTKYRNGDPILSATDNAAWAGLTTGTGAYCWYDNSETTNKANYGALYNWYAVADPRNIAPSGWHVASYAEWTTLTSYLGGESVAGGNLKEAGFIHWVTPNIGATDSSGFTALPGGYRNYSGLFYLVGTYGNWWSSTAYNASTAWTQELDNVTANVLHYCGFKEIAFSVRCIRD
ncbi:MAG: fibrobacter succinogenes major paralogous domain-containing protein [Mariniphaga sp.]